MPTDPKALKTYQAPSTGLNSESAEKRSIRSAKPPGRMATAPNACARRIPWQPALVSTRRPKRSRGNGCSLLPPISNAPWLTIASRSLFSSRESTTRKNKCFDESCDEFKTALQLEPKLTTIHYAMGVSLAHMHQDDAARAEFSTFLSTDTVTPNVHERAQRYLDRIDLARARMAPPFSITTIDGQHISLDSLAGKVVLIDFWATWCGPCREALPHIRDIAHRFQEQPLVVISISLDKDEDKWKEFVAKNQMTWLQYRDGGFNGAIAKSFGVNAIPATFTIDADGVLEDQHVGDANIEGKLKKLVASAAELASRKPSTPSLEHRPSDAPIADKTPGASK